MNDGKNRKISPESESPMSSDIFGQSVDSSPRQVVLNTLCGSTLTVQFFCGGVLVAPDIVMSAGHCKSEALLSVVVNGYDESKSDHLNRRQHARVVANARRHPGYNGKNYENDIMLLKLSSPVYEIDYIQMNFDNSYPLAGQDVTAMGLGRAQAGSYSQFLRDVTIQAVDSNVCNAKYNKGGLTVPAPIMRCAGIANAGGKDACIWDSGGPLVDSNDLLVGISSWAVGCAKKEYPGVYTRVSGFKTWLTDNICSMSDAPPNWCPGSPTSAVVVAADVTTTRDCKDGDGTFHVSSLRRGGNMTCAQLKSLSSADQQIYCTQTSAWDLCEETCGRCGSSNAVSTTMLSKTTRHERE